jgi:hypothetical protein
MHTSKQANGGAMKQKFIPLSLAVLAILFANLACQTTPPRSTKSVEITPLATSTAEKKVPKLPSAISSTEAGIACVGLYQGGISCLDENGWQTYTTKNSDLASDYLTDGTLCPDGRLAFADYDGISLFDGQHWLHTGKSKSFSSVDGLACAKDGSFWVAHFKGVSRYNRGIWTTYDPSKLASGDSVTDLVYDVKIGPNGDVWVVTSRSIARFSDERWQVFQQGQGFSEPMFFIVYGRRTAQAQ